MQLGVYSLKRVLYEGQAESLNCKTISGEITILDNHRPLVSMLASGTIKIVDNNKKEHYIPVSTGFLEVQLNSRARLIVDEPSR